MSRQQLRSRDEDREIVTFGMQVAKSLLACNGEEAVNLKSILTVNGLILLYSLIRR